MRVTTRTITKVIIISCGLHKNMTKDKIVHHLLICYS